MSFQAYIDTIQAKTGKTPQDFLQAAKEQNILRPDTKVMEIVDWLKTDYGLGHGHAMAIVQWFKIAGEYPVPEK